MGSAWQTWSVSVSPSNGKKQRKRLRQKGHSGISSILAVRLNPENPFCNLSGYPFCYVFTFMYVLSLFFRMFCYAPVSRAAGGFCCLMWDLPFCQRLISSYCTYCSVMKQVERAGSIYILKTLVQGSTFIHILKKMCMEVWYLKPKLDNVAEVIIRLLSLLFQVNK